MNYARPTLATIGDPEHDATMEHLSAMPAARAKFYLNSLHLEQKITAADLAYWLGALEIDPSL